MPEFAKRMEYMAASADVIRGLFSAMTDPQTISFGGGAPATEALPVEEIHALANEVLTREARGCEALQYGAPAGLKQLREIVADKLLAPKGVDARADDIIIVNGGLETMNLLCQVFINPGDVILVESPTFVHCVEIFEMFEARCVGCRMDDFGLVMEDVEEKIRKFHPKMVYVIPTFQNPTGKTLPAARRRKLAELGSAYDVLILEDDPYRDLRYSGEELKPIKAYDTTGHTVLANSFSKIFSPGSRLGYVFAEHRIIEKLFDAKTATNSHTSMLAQVLCAEFFARGCFDEHLKKLRAIHRERRDAMMAALEKYLPKGTKWVFPDGGLFSWVELPGNIDTTELLKEANAAKVSYVAGAGFFVGNTGEGKNCMRISFGNVSPEKIETGMKRLGDLIKRKL
ncbi:PLP-dependent aminotransferase family protein [Pyramidobacter piscolens]|uniref:aminotransferase-like domain-containing protein n=1 Tax=Pyramidobacter piscolens TaxID=638849 RepID=UPI001FCB9BA6|nr:PLP-dependent aminotransferase family protein [Pyramidobacter piscolens]BDF77919.1 aminotransferase [Pyramidobacter piscolens]